MESQRIAVYYEGTRLEVKTGYRWNNFCHYGIVNGAVFDLVLLAEEEKKGAEPENDEDTYSESYESE